VIDSDAPVSGPDAAAVLPVSAATIRSWAHRGYKDTDGQHRKLEAVDHGGPRRSARYRWSDLLDAEHATRHNPRSPGRAQLVTAA
jgi:hypothetical protein